MRALHRFARRGLLTAGVLLAGPAAAEAPCDGAVCFAEPVARYGHAVLGDTPEWAALDGPGGRFVLPEHRVFEDLVPRLADLDGDGRDEAVVVESDTRQGARLSVYALPEEGAPELLAATPFIGRSFRWLAPVGIADLDADGRLEIAYVETPHIGGTLRIWTLREGALLQEYAAPGFSNHRIGQDFIPGGIRDCGPGPEMVTVDAGWSRVLVTRWTPRGYETEDAGPVDDLVRVLACG
ncbi:FG-GAP repeat domain-containing protein [Pontivivens ytuae]|uniref:VCBS repeat-containing protein n=1 Tax=Pontivivens ytuae TaxID=2789856 RepID=A0A7S9LPR1_9RHOB|nr:VCBS repeat-containing protein [Pontivivens ytuae]QPH53019.1 VCBS repeat-containing protein [Pontivivens ytuae]